MQVRPEEHGLSSPFKESSTITECTILGAFSAFWWQRTGEFLLRQVHGLLAWKPHKAFLFVDDLLCALFRDSAPDMFALVVLFFCATAAPISWKKAQFQDSLVWCGWEINFSHDTFQVVSAKLTKLDALIKSDGCPAKHWSGALACLFGPPAFRLNALDTASILDQGSQN